MRTITTINDNAGVMTFKKPESKVKAKRLTIADIKRLTADTAPYFFTRETLKFFNQRMSDFKVSKDGDLYYVWAPMRDHNGKQIGTTERWFNPSTNKLQMKREG